MLHVGVPLTFRKFCWLGEFNLKKSNSCTLRIRLFRLAYSIKAPCSLSVLLHIVNKDPINKELYPAQQDNFETSLSNVRAVSINTSAIVKYVARVYFISLSVNTYLKDNVST